MLEGVPAAVSAARDAADVVLRDRGRRTVPGEMSARALLEGAQDSAALDLSGDTAIDEAVAAGAVRLSTQLIDLAEEIRRQPARVLARAHVLVARDLADAGAISVADLGQVRAEARERIRGVCEMLAGRTTASPIVVGAVAHAELAVTEPFARVSGVLARAVDHMVLVEGGIDPRAVLLPESAHRVAGPAYRRALEGYVSGGVDGVRAWLIHCCDALTHGAERSPIGAAQRFRDDQV